MIEHKIVNAVMREIEALRRRQAEIAEETRVKDKLLDKSIAKIQQLILHNQGTSGDPITDYFLAAYGIIDDTEVSKPFREVERQMVGKKGELFLVVQREKKEMFRGDHQESHLDYLKIRSFLGILSAEKLYLDAEALRYGLQTKEYVELSGSGWETLNRNPVGPFLFDHDGFQNIGKTIHAGRRYSGLALEILIGDAVVLGYSPYEQSMLGHQRWVIALNEAARMLGKDVPEAPEEKIAREEE